MFKIQATRLRASESQVRKLKTSANVLRRSGDSPVNAVQLFASVCDITLGNYLCCITSGEIVQQTV